MRPPTTANTHVPRPFAARRLAQALALAWAALWVATAVDPADRGEWLLENLLPASTIAFLALSYRRLQLSDASYAALAAFLALHAVGAHYAYEAAPLPVLDGVLGLGGAGARRNNFDRLVHLAFGLLVAYPLRELLLWVTGRRRGWASTFAATAVVALGALYEVFEWLAAAWLAPGLGRAFVGAQGDAWDAQKDMALAAVGAVVSLALVEAAHGALARRDPARYAEVPRAPWSANVPDGARRRRGQRAA